MRFEIHKNDWHADQHPEPADMQDFEEEMFATLADRLQDESSQLASAYPAPSAEKILAKATLLAHTVPDQEDASQHAPQRNVRPVAVVFAGTAAALLIAVFPWLQQHTGISQRQQVAIETHAVLPGSPERDVRPTAISTTNNGTVVDGTSDSHSVNSTTEKEAESFTTETPDEAALSGPTGRDVRPVPVSTFHRLDAAEQEAMLDLLDDQECRLSI